MSAAANRFPALRPLLFDAAMAVFELSLWPGARTRLLSQARGRVLEVAGGTGLNLPHYPADVQLTLTDLDGERLKQAQLRGAAIGLAFEAGVADAMALPFADRSFDTVVATLAMCGIPDPVAALTEMGRVCREDGRILLLDHVRSHHRSIGLPQDWMTALTARGAGEYLNRDTLQLAQAAGLGVIATRSWRIGIMRELVLSPQPGKTSGTERRVVVEAC